VILKQLSHKSSFERFLKTIPLFKSCWYLKSASSTLINIKLESEGYTFSINDNSFNESISLSLSSRMILIFALTKSIFLRDQIILSEIRKHEEIIKRIKDSNSFDDQTNIQIETDLKKLYLRKNLLSKNFFTRIYFSLFDKKYNNIWGSKISKFLDILRVS